MMSLLGAAERGEVRSGLLSEIFRAGQNEGVYAGSREELTRWEDDPLSVLPLAFVAGRVLASPARAESIIRAAVEAYSLDEAAIRRVLDLSADLAQVPSPGILDYRSMRL